MDTAPSETSEGEYGGAQSRSGGAGGDAKSKPRTLFKRVARSFADVLFPPVCVGCGGLVEGGRLRHVCTACVATIHFVEPPHCTTCGSPFFGEVEGERMCPHCEGLHPLYAEGRTLTLFKGPARALIHELKYHKGRHVLADIEEMVRGSPYMTDFLRGAILVPVPLHPRKERERTYNQTALLAEALARAAGGETRVERILRRVIDTPSQTAFDRKARRLNLKNAFALTRGATITLSSPYILVDDVFTTGSTLNSCADALRRAGVLNLRVVTFGHG